MNYFWLRLEPKEKESCASVCDSIQKNSENEFLQHSKESRGFLGARVRSREHLGSTKESKRLEVIHVEEEGELKRELKRALLG